MNKYVLMLAAAGLIAAAPAYYAFQAQAEESAPTSAEADAAASTGTDATSATEEMSPESKDAAAGDAANGETAPKPARVQGATE